jgi:hypothetical protein
MWNKLRLSIALVCLSSAALFAQVAADPQDFFYDDLVVWETIGLVGNLPAARPYPLQLVKEILLTVIERGDSTQSRIAQTHYDRFFGKTISPGVRAEMIFDNHARKQLAFAAGIDLNAYIEDNLTVSASADAIATNKLFDEELLPIGQRSNKELVDDSVNVGPFWLLPSINSSVAFGNTEYYVDAGLMRGSYGPIHQNGVIVGPQALHSGQVNFALMKSTWGYDASLYAITATSVDDPDTYYPEKYLSVHSLSWRPNPKFTVSILDSAVFGERLELMYLVPTLYFASQGVGGFGDNSHIGGMFTAKPVRRLKLDGVLYLDDVGFNEFVKLKMDARFRAAAQLAVSYAPRSPEAISLLSLDYTAVTPYAYSHRNSGTADLDEQNYQNYLHAGRPFGADLNPNSDRINLKFKLRPLEDVDVDIVGALTRHANVNEGIGQNWVREFLIKKNAYCTDGTMNNSSFTEYEHAFLHYNPFLVQDTTQYIWQTGFDALCRLPILKTSGRIVFRLGYRFECNVNDGVNRKMYKYIGDDAYRTIFGLDDDAVVDTDAKKAPEGDDLTDGQKAAVDAIAREQLKDWLKNATGVKYNHYISAGFEFFY